MRCDYLLKARSIGRARQVDFLGSQDGVGCPLVRVQIPRQIEADNILEIESPGRLRDVSLLRVEFLGKLRHVDLLEPLDWRIPEQVEV